MESFVFSPSTVVNTALSYQGFILSRSSTDFFCNLIYGEIFFIDLLVYSAKTYWIQSIVVSGEKETLGIKKTWKLLNKF